MYFKKLEIFGFKSFADKTVLNFEPGITAIVGPNGCGKSNVFDAIRWGLGEQSIRELRGTVKEDVIFHGTDTKPSLGFAEVSLTFSNTQRILPIEYDEVTITRRLFRSGESEYLINKTVVRLKDIQELLMGTGIGEEAYSLIQQGNVDLIVNAKPEERRVLLDEASGITKYKAKKKEALSKLKDTENNLLRVNDIVGEIKRQISSIERQAKKARRYKEEFEKLKQLEIIFATRQMRAFFMQKDSLNEQMQALKDKESALSAEHERLSTELEAYTDRLADIEQQINNIRTEEVRLDSQIDMANKQIAFNKERIAVLTEEDKKALVRKDELIRQCEIQQGKLEQLRQEYSSLEEGIKEKEVILSERRDELSCLQSSIDTAMAGIKEHEEAILSLASRQVTLRNELTDVMKEIQGALAKKRRLELENEKVMDERRMIEERLTEIKQQRDSLRSEINHLCEQKVSAIELLEEEKENLSEIEQELGILEKKKVFFESQKEFIEKLHTQYEDIPDPVIKGRLITGILPSQEQTGFIGKVTDIKKLGEKQTDILNSCITPIEGGDLYEVICESKFIELDPQQISLKIDTIIKQIHNMHGKREVSSAKIKEQSRIIEGLDIEIIDMEKKLSVLDSQQQDILRETQKLREEIDIVCSEIVEADTIINSARKKEEELNFELDTVTQDIEWKQTDIKDKQEWINLRLKENEQKLITIPQIEKEISALREKLDSFSETQKMFSATLDNLLEEIKQIEDDIVERATKRNGYEKDIELMAEQIEKTMSQKDVLSRSLSDYEQSRVEVGARLESLRSEISILEQELGDVRSQIHECRLAEQEVVFNEKGIKDRLKQVYKIDLDEEISEAVDGQENNETILIDDSVDNNIRIGNDVASGDSVVRAISEHEAYLWEMDKLQMEIERLRKRCDSFGNVNLVAIEEYEQLKERFEFFTKQQSDLLESRSRLMATIKKINRSTREMFMDTFTKVNEQFRVYFRTLFGGGDGQLVLLDPENVLESGIDIVARPPGKKTQNISLLSGGEKSLTAIALIFGVFKVKPSPFCVLDEIDAALDESNVDRFSYLLKDFSKIAQFIVITHNKKTIAKADVLYGITMQERGVSRVVSVKFSEQTGKVTVAESVPTAV